MNRDNKNLYADLRQDYLYSDSLADINISPSDVRIGKHYKDYRGEDVYGLLETRDVSSSYGLYVGNSLTFKAGIYDKDFTIHSYREDTPGTAEASDIIEGKSAWVNGYYIIGTRNPNINKYSKGTATPDTILKGDTAWVNGEEITGKIERKPARDIILNPGDRYELEPGYYVNTNIICNTMNTSGTATPEDILKGKTAWVNGQKITGELNVVSDKKLKTLSQIQVEHVDMKSDFLEIPMRTDNLYGFYAKTPEFSSDTFIPAKDIAEYDSTYPGLLDLGSTFGFNIHMICYTRPDENNRSLFLGNNYIQNARFITKFFNSDDSIYNKYSWLIHYNGTPTTDEDGNKFISVDLQASGALFYTSNLPDKLRDKYTTRGNNGYSEEKLKICIIFKQNDLKNPVIRINNPMYEDILLDIYITYNADIGYLDKVKEENNANS